MFRPIYEPRTRAKEYADLAINIYDVCNHGCKYCYARMMYERYHGKGSFDKTPEARIDIVESVKRQLARENYANKKIMTCFMCDPYPAEIDTTPTREIIKAIKAVGAHVQILTKGGFRAERDFDLLDQNDSFGVTVSGNREISRKNEPNAANVTDRLRTLKLTHKKGIKTWISCEPVFDVDQIYDLIIYADFIDLYKIGKLNYMPSDINWAEFGKECERLCKLYNRNYYIKEDLRQLIDKDVVSP